MDFCSLMYERKGETSLYASFPHINDLVCIKCKIDITELRDSSAKSTFHWQIMKCRSLIYLISDVIASPVRCKTNTFIFVVARKQLADAGKLTKILENFKLMNPNRLPLTTEIYKECLIFTMQTRLAPLWNKVGDYLVRGKEFYNSVNGVDAVKVNINIQDGNIYLKLHAEKIRISRARLEDYVPSSAISNFLADPKGYINLSNYPRPFIHVLPSTKKGIVVSISKELPVRCVFKDYDQLRRHWKNMYGYSLPRNKNEISAFYQIKFLIPNSNIFIYPSVCVTSGPLDIIPSRRDNSPIIKHFLSDINSMIPLICGKQLHTSIHSPATTVSTNANSTCTEKDSLKKDLSTNPEKEGVTSAQLEFSVKNLDEPVKNVNVPVLGKMQLAKLHQIHNISFDEKMRHNTNDRKMKKNQDDELTQCLNTERELRNENVENIYIENNIPINSSAKFTVSNEEMISKYFKIEKKRPGQNEPNTAEKRRCVAIGETVTKITSKENSCTSSQGMGKNNIEEMVRKNWLQELQHSDLSEWLNKHSIQHKSTETKSELIKKILSHMRNTEILHKFRI